MVGAVPDFQPVGVIAVFIRHRGSIRRHNLAENQSLIITQRAACGMHQIILRPCGIIRLLHGLFGADDDHNCHQRNQHSADEDIQHTAFLLTIFHSGRHLLRLCATLPFFGLIRLHGNPFCGQEDIHPRRGAGRSGGFPPSVFLSTNRTMQHRPILHCITKTYSRASIMTILRGFFIFWSQFG
ncbi:unknown [Faecalibacterium sp. CAG:74]|nr:unknown [Faecalibacterium sp. CAG:74]